MRKTRLRQDYRTLDSTGEEMRINKTIYLDQGQYPGRYYRYCQPAQCYRPLSAGLPAGVFGKAGITGSIDRSFTIM